MDHPGSTPFGLMSFFLRVRKLDQVIRFNTVPRKFPQSVSCHSYHVAMICYVVAMHEQFDSSLVGSVLSKALIHDLEEVEISDIPHYVKHHPEFGVGGDLASIASERLSERLLGSFSESLRTRLLASIAAAKSPDVAGRLVSFADMYELAIHCMFEVGLGNRSFWHIYQYSWSLLNNPEKYPVVEELSGCRLLVDNLPDPKIHGPDKLSELLDHLAN